MYVVPAPGDRLGFGDVISAPWLFDLYLRHDAVALSYQDRRGGRQWFENRAPRAGREAGKDGVLSHADFALGSGNPRMAIIVTDDCEMENLSRRAAAGRILVAGVEQAPADEIALAATRSTYRRFPLAPDSDIPFAGGIVELQRIFSVFLPSLTVTPPAHERPVSLDPEARGRLSQSLCAHVTRHGPIVASQESAKLAKLMSANGDPAAVAELKASAGGRLPEPRHMAVAEALTRGLSHAWVLEGRVLDQVSDAWESGDPPTESVDAVREQLRLTRDSLDEALRLLDNR